MALAKKKTARKKAAQQRRERHATLARLDILNAAAAAFAEQGYRGATVQDIAARAGYTAASLYTYFPGKAAIFADLVELIVQDIETVFAQSGPPGVTFADRLETLTRDLFAAAERHQHAVVYFLQMQEQGGYRPTGTGRRSPDMLGALQTWFEHNASPRDLPNLKTEEAAVHYWSLTLGLVRMWAHEGGASPLVEHAERLTHFYLNGAQGKGRSKR
jgi:AcrR family transcriptional regulator